MISRRAALGGTAAVIVVAGVAGTRLAGVDDDVLRALGARPRPVPDAGDTTLLESAAQEQAEVVASLAALVAAHEDPELEALQTVAAEQLDGLGGAELPSVPDAQADRAAATGAVATLVAAAAERRRDDALAALSPALVTVLASLSAGQAQLARRLGSRVTPEPDARATEPLPTLQARLALEHEAVWLLSTIGGAVEPLRDRARQAFTEHRSARDRLLRSITGLSAEPVSAQASYGIPPTDREEAEAAVADVERRLAAAALDGVPRATPRARRSALAALQAAALAALDWGAEPQAFPGLD